jgi:hypothetical protein
VLLDEKTQGEVHAGMCRADEEVNGHAPKIPGTFILLSLLQRIPGDEFKSSTLF